jgi:hypothetical protein
MAGNNIFLYVTTSRTTGLEVVPDAKCRIDPALRGF